MRFRKTQQHEPVWLSAIWNGCVKDINAYIWGTNGTDGVIRMNTSMAWSKDVGNAFVTLAVGDVDCGTF